MLDQELKQTPLYDEHLEAEARMVAFGGWAMPLTFTGHLEEHRACREGAAAFDVSHMGQIMFEGRHALKLAQQAFTKDLAALEVGHCAYTLMLNDEGGIVDDLIISRLGPEAFFAVVNAATYKTDVQELVGIAKTLRVEEAALQPVTEHWSMIALQGPKWKEVAGKALAPGAWSELAPMRIGNAEFKGATAMISTTGYTGEPGCELSIAPRHAVELWRALLAAGATPAGLAARDSLRLEAGMCLSGQDIGPKTNPLEARLGWVVDLEKESFRGQDALRRVKERGGPGRLLVGLLPDGRRIPRAGMKILLGGEAIGEVTSGGFSPELDRPIAMGYVTAEHAARGTRVTVDLERGTCEAEVTRPPFVKKS